VKKPLAILLILLFAFNCFSQTKNEQLEQFYTILGNEKAVVLEKAIKSFDKFLLNNFKNCKNDNQRIIGFLKHYQTNEYKSNNNWIFETEKNRKLFNINQKIEEGTVKLVIE